MTPVKRCPHVPQSDHPSSFWVLLIRWAAAIARHSTCASPASPRQAHPDCMGGGSSLRQMMHAPASGPPAEPAPANAVGTAALIAARKHSCLWPPCFQCTFWHAAEQYFTPLHLEHRCNPGLTHPTLAHLGTSSAPALVLSPPTPCLPASLSIVEGIRECWESRLSNAMTCNIEEGWLCACDALRSGLSRHQLIAWLNWVRRNPREVGSASKREALLGVQMWCRVRTSLVRRSFVHAPGKGRQGQLMKGGCGGGRC
jgi:hypothetical protein